MQQERRVRPRILELTDKSRGPITLFLNSRGGSTEVSESILRLLRRTTDDDPRVSRIITVVASQAQAQSAAANLLSAGDLAIAHPESRILYHGARWPLPVQELTGEWARIARTLPTFHEIAAATLARNSVRRFLFIVSAYRELFAKHRADAGDPALSDLQCFQAILRGKLSPAAQIVLDRAIPLWESYNGLLIQFQKRLRRGRTVTKAYLRKLMLHASIEYENSKGNEDWDGGLSKICDDFYFLNAYFDAGKLCEWIATPETQMADTDVEAAYFLQFRFFSLALCRGLQEGENNLTPLDAMWLGLIDTVRSGIPALSAT